jgi:SAM-dependent methyltransferase
MTVTHDVSGPSPWIVRFEPLLARASRVLDVASGAGRHCAFLSARGHRVTAIDRDAQALSACQASQRICADLEALDRASLTQRLAPPYDAIVVTNYLHRPLFNALVSWLAPNGVLLYETFALGQEQFGRPSNPDFLLRPGELLTAFADLSVVAFEQGQIEGAPPRVVQRVCATQRRGSQPLCGFVAPH